MNLKELGEALRNERERQGLSLDDIFEKTKISRDNLKNIEAGQVNDLPHPVYARGFIKNYANYLGLNGQEYSQIFEQNIVADGQISEEGKMGEEDDFETDNEPQKMSRKWALFSVILTVILLSILGFLVYDIFLKSSPSHEAKSLYKEQSSQVVSDHKSDHLEKNVLLEGDTPVPSAKRVMNTTSQNVTAKENNASSLIRDLETNRSTLAFIEKNIQNTTVRLEMSPEEKHKDQAPLNDTRTMKQRLGEEQGKAIYSDNSTSERELHRYTLQIFAFEACWMKSFVDNNSKEIYLRPGESVRFRFQDQLKVKLGNAGGVTLKYNDKIYPLEAKSGQVKTLLFPPQ